ncbi:hypothetical protein MPER_02286 [Moniliophthora perniciosa FA553]|nr:hypothetical protein MPER_02286 [Moniliophthora perniciosa FA553]
MSDTLLSQIRSLVTVDIDSMDPQVCGTAFTKRC